MAKWKNIPNYEGCYQITKKGKVRSVDRYVKTYGGGLTKIKGRILKASHKGDVYPRVVLTIDNNPKNFRVHRLVMLTFVGPCPEGQEVMHLDGDPGNPKLKNLRYGSKSCNAAFKVDHGTHLCGEDMGNARFTEKQVLNVRAFHKLGVLNYSEIARLLDTSPSVINNIVNRKSWRHI